MQFEIYEMFELKFSTPHVGNYIIVSLIYNMAYGLVFTICDNNVCIPLFTEITNFFNRVKFKINIY